MPRTNRATKLSVSIPQTIAAQVKRRAGKRGLSAFVARALQRELENERLEAYLRQLEAELGPADEALVREAERLFA